MDEARVEAQRDPGPGDACAECELLATDNDDAVAVGGAFDLDRRRSRVGADTGRRGACEVARPAASALPSPPPAGPQSVQRRVPKDGVVMVAGQRIRVGRTHAGTIVTIVVEDHHFRVLDGINELSLHARTSTKPIRNFNAHRPRQR